MGRVMPKGRFSPHPVRLVDGRHVKFCPTCERDRSIDDGEFATRISHSTGNPFYVSVCNECNAKRHREYRAAQDDDDREREARRNRERRRRLRTRKART